MPLTKVKPSKSQRVTEKSEIDDLFSQLMTLYHPGPLPPLSLPIFQGAEVPVLMFPTLQIAQARVWRNQEAPNSESLKAVINDVCRTGLAMGGEEEEYGQFWKAKEEIGMVIALCETLFRPMRAVELRLERLFPDFLFLRDSGWALTPTAVDQLTSDFRHRWKEEERICGREWVLAAGSTPLPVKHRPALIAPWVIGVVVKRWLAIKRTSEVGTTDMVLRLMAVLLDREIRPEELLHWEGLLERVLVTTDNGKAPLPGYIVNPMARLTTQVVLDQLTPTLFLQTFLIDRGACEQFAKILGQAWKVTNRVTVRSKNTRSPRMREATSSGDQEVRFVRLPCLRCKKQILPGSIYEHFETAHGIEKSLVESLPNRRELRLISTGEILYRWEDS